MAEYKSVRNERFPTTLVPQGKNKKAKANIMKKTGDSYKSEFGWSITLPETWKRLTRRNPDDRTPVAVFSTPQDWSLALTWMIDKNQSDDETLTAFDTATMIPGRLQIEEGIEVAQKLFPRLGEVVRVTSIKLPDGKRALEIFEIILSKDESKVEKVSYSLVLPRRKRGEYRNKVHLQRLSFVAPPQTFHERIHEIARTARSFHYKALAA